MDNTLFDIEEFTDPEVRRIMQGNTADTAPTVSNMNTRKASTTVMPTPAAAPVAAYSKSKPTNRLVFVSQTKTTQNDQTLIHRPLLWRGWHHHGR